MNQKNQENHQNQKNQQNQNGNMNLSIERCRIRRLLSLTLVLTLLFTATVFAKSYNLDRYTVITPLKNFTFVGRQNNVTHALEFEYSSKNRYENIEYGIVPFHSSMVNTYVVIMGMVQDSGYSVVKAITDFKFKGGQGFYIGFRKSDHGIYDYLLAEILPGHNDGDYIMVYDTIRLRKASSKVLSKKNAVKLANTVTVK